MIPDEYKTGNRKFDEKIAMSFAKDPLRPNQLQRIMAENGVVEKEKHPRMQVSEKELRTYKDGTLFASQGEMERWDYLLHMQRAGGINNLQRQVVFELQEEFIHRQWGNVSSLIYVADFTYLNLTFRKGFPNRECVEDSKGKWLTDIYRLKRKLFLHRYGELLFFEV